MRPIAALTVGVLLLGVALSTPVGAQPAVDADCREEARDELWAHGTVTVTETRGGETLAYAMPSADGLHAYLQTLNDCSGAPAAR